MAENKGLLLVVSGPSGVGKGTICRKVIATDGTVKLSVSATTRKKRPDEIEGQDYYFKSREEFERMVNAGEFLEHMPIFNSNLYGTLKAPVVEQLEMGNSVILEIDYHGALNVKKSYPEAVLVFVAPPAFAELKNRLIRRNTESAAEIDARLKTAMEEIDMMEKFDYIIVNDVADAAAEKLLSILKAEKCHLDRNEEFIHTLREGIQK